MSTQQKVEEFYREVFSDQSVNRDEFSALRVFFETLNPPPDKLVWLRATAFRIGCEFLIDGNRDTNVSLLRAINAVVHVLEEVCMEPREDRTSPDAEDLDESIFEEFYRSLLTSQEDNLIDAEESKEIMELLIVQSPVPTDKLVWLRATAFRIGSELLSEDDNDANVCVLKCVNSIVHCVEYCFLAPKSYTLVMPEEHEPEEISVEKIGLNASLQKAVQYFWDLDVNRLTFGDEYTINVQDGKKPYHSHDAASEPLFTRVSPQVFRRSTYKTFLALLDNYSKEVGTEDAPSNAEKREVWEFLDAIMQTAPMQFCHKYCVKNAKQHNVPHDVKGFKRLLYRIWFEPYSRSRYGRPDSSGFEHVFVGEIKNEKVTGFHNWIHFYLEEKRGNLDYRGYIKPRSRNNAPTDGNDYLLSLQFTWNGIEKFVGGGFVGVSPEFEMALYTTCFLLGEEDNMVELDTGCDVFEMNIKCYTMGGDRIGTSYPEILAHYD